MLNNSADKLKIVKLKQKLETVLKLKGSLRKENVMNVRYGG